MRQSTGTATSALSSTQSDSKNEAIKELGTKFYQVLVARDVDDGLLDLAHELFKVMKAGHLFPYMQDNPRWTPSSFDQNT